MPNILFKKNYNFFFLFAIFWLIVFLIEYLLTSGNPNFICNDSFQYLSIAKNIFEKKQLTNITQYSLDLYYDELSLFNYNFTNIKPYHFPSYSVFLTLFYYIYNNDNFVVYASQYLSFLLYTCFVFLIFRHYLNVKKSLFLTFLVFFTNSFIIYISDSGKEIICNALLTMVIYLALYSPNKNQLYIKIISSITLTFLSLTRNFHLVFAFLLVIYYWLSPRFKDNDDEHKLSDKINYLILIFLIPLFFYIYFYYFQYYHLFLFDNRTDIYGGKTFADFSFRIFGTGMVGFFLYFVLFFMIAENGFVLEDFLLLFNLFQTHALSIIGMICFYTHFFKNFKNNKKIDKLLIINLFFTAILIAVIVRFSVMGFRLILGYLPFVFLFLYQNYFNLKTHKLTKNQFLKYLFLTLLVLNFLYYMIFLKNYSNFNDSIYKKNFYFLDIAKKFKPKFIAINAELFLPHSMPFFHLFPMETYFYSNWNFKNLCSDLEYYHQHKINFDMILTRKVLNQESCNFVNNNFRIIDISHYGYVYYAKNKIIK